MFLVLLPVYDVLFVWRLSGDELIGCVAVVKVGVVRPV
jgi:hypothetical protein